MKLVWNDVIEKIRADDGSAGIAFIAINEEKNRNSLITTIPTLIKYTKDKGADIYRGKPRAKKIIKWIRGE
jgi:hypothetical protein